MRRHKCIGSLSSIAARRDVRPRAISCPAERFRSTSQFPQFLQLLRAYARAREVPSPSEVLPILADADSVDVRICQDRFATRAARSREGEDPFGNCARDRLAKPDDPEKGNKNEPAPSFETAYGAGCVGRCGHGCSRAFFMPVAVEVGRSVPAPPDSATMGDGVYASRLQF